MDKCTTTKRGPTLEMRDAIMIAWKKECFRSQSTAAVFGAEPIFIWPDVESGRLKLLRRYLASMRETRQVIRQRKPQTVILLNQPPLLILAALREGCRRKFVIILDFHSGALSKPAWRPFLPMYKRVVRNAPFVIAHNRVDGGALARWGGRPAHLLTLPRVFPAAMRTRAADSDRILLVCSFADDEPISILFDAMRACPEIRFEVTGNHRKAAAAIGEVPGNVTLLGFVDYDLYLDRFATATAVATFSTRGHIMQMAVEEGISLGVPVVTNISPTLKEVLEDGGIFTKIETHALAEAFRRAVADREDLRTRARALLGRRQAGLASSLAELAALAPRLFARPNERIATTND